MAWVETIVVALVSGGGVRALDAWLARRDKDREFARVSQKDEYEIASKIREEMRKYTEMLEVRTKKAEEEAQKLRDSSGKHAPLPADVVAPPKPVTLSVALLEPPFSDADLKLSQYVREEVSRQFGEYRDALQKLVSMAEFSIRRSREERGLPPKVEPPASDESG